MNKKNHLLIPFLIITLSYLLICSSVLAQQITVPPKKKAETTVKKPATSTPKPVYGSLTDSRDGKTYKTVKIGTQTWMAENLAYKASSSCWTYDNNESNVAKYGYLYDWETAKKSCPSGWHLSSLEEWTKVTNFLGGDKIAGAKLKSTTGWINTGTGTTNNNSSGFCALPGGYRKYDGIYDQIGEFGWWWSSTESGSNSGIIFNHILSSYRGINLSVEHKSYGLSIRCIKD